MYFVISIRSVGISCVAHVECRIQEITNQPRLGCSCKNSLITCYAVLDHCRIFVPSTGCDFMLCASTESLHTNFFSHASYMKTDMH